MATETVQTKLNLDASQFIQALDKILAKVSEISKTLSEKFKVDSSGLDKLDSGLKNSSKNASDLKSSFADITKGLSIGFGVAIFDKLTSAISGSVEQMGKLGVEYDTALKELSAISGIVDTGGLEKLGQAARDLNLQFGTGIKENVESFKAVLSRFGPDIAGTPEALKEMGVAINTLAVAGGVSAKDSMDAITQTMMQFGVATGTANEIANTSTRIMNTLAAGAQVGAAEVDQVSKAMVKVGANAKNANVSIEETNAAIQVVASKGGVFGENAGEKLSAIFRALVNASGPASKALQSVGVDSQQLAKTLTTQGLAAALEEIAGKTNDLSAAAKSQVFGTVFGADAVAVGSALVSNVDTLKEYTKAVTDTSIGFEQAAIIQNSFANQSKILGAKIEDGLLSVFQKVSPILGTFVSGLGSLIDFITKNIGTIGPVLVGVAAALTAFGVASLVTSGIFTTAFTAMSGALTAFTATLLANPVTAIVAGIALAISGIVAYSNYLSESAQRELDASKAVVDSINVRIEAKQKEIELEKGNLTNIAQLDQLGRKYDELAGKTNRTAQEEKQLVSTKKELQEQLIKLNQKYPESIDLTKSWSDNMTTLKKDLKLGDVDYSKLNNETRTAIQNYEQLGNKANLTAEEQKKLKSANEVLAKTYPGVVKEGASFADNLNNIQNAAGLSSDKLKGLQSDIRGLQSDLEKASLKVSISTIAVNKDAILRELDGTFGRSPIYIPIQTKIDKILATNNVDELNKLYNEGLDVLDPLLKQDPEQYKLIQGKLTEIFNIRTKMLTPEQKITEQAQKQAEFGTKEVDLKEKSAKKEEDAFKIAQDKFKANEDSYKTELKTYELRQKDLILDQDRKRNSIDDLVLAQEKLSTANKTVEAFKKQFAAFGTIADDGLTLSVKPGVKEEDKNKLQKEWDTIVLDLQATRLQIKEITSKVNVDDKEAQKKLKELQDKEYELNITLGLVDQRDLTAKLEQKVTEEESKLKSLKLKLEASIDPAQQKDINDKIVEQETILFNARKDVRESSIKEWSSIERQYYKDNTTILEDSLEFQQGLLTAKRDFDLKINKGNITEQTKIWSSFWKTLTDLQNKYKVESKSVFDVFNTTNLTKLSDAFTSSITKGLSSALSELPKLRSSLKETTDKLKSDEQKYLEDRKKIELELQDLTRTSDGASQESIDEKKKQLKELDDSWKKSKDDITKSIDEINNKLTDLTPWEIFKTGVQETMTAVSAIFKESLDKSTANALESYKVRNAKTQEFADRENEIKKLAISDYDQYVSEKEKLRIDRETEALKQKSEIQSQINGILLDGAAAATAALAEFATGGIKNIGQLGAAFIDLADKMIIPIGLLLIEKNLEALGVLGVATAIAGMIALKIALQGFKSTIAGGFKEGGEVSQGILKHKSGLVPTSTRVIEINETGEPEYIVNAKATKKHKGLLDLINQGKDPSGYFKNKLQQSNIYNTNLDLSEMSKKLDITNDRLLKIEYAQLNSYSRTKVQVDMTPLQLSGTDLVAAVDKINRRRMS